MLDLHVAISLMQWVFEHLNLVQDLKSPSNDQATSLLLGHLCHALLLLASIIFPHTTTQSLRESPKHIHYNIDFSDLVL